MQLIKNTKDKEDIILVSEKGIEKIRKKKAPIEVKPPLSAMTTPHILLYEKEKGAYEKLKKEAIRELIKSVTERIKIAFPETEEEIAINPKQLILINRVLIRPKVDENNNYLYKWFKSKKRGEDPFEKLENFLDPELIKREMIKQGLFIKEEKIPQTNETLFRIKLPKQVTAKKSKNQIKKVRKRLKRIVKKI